MTVRENLMMVPADQSGETLWNAWFGRGRIARGGGARLEGRRGDLDFLTISAT
jgi:branched-chain amino acid transport system ATP-binding protein